MEAIRCPKCNKLLGYFHGEGTVACPRCRKDTIVFFDTKNKIIEIRATRAPQPEQVCGAFLFVAEKLLKNSIDREIVNPKNSERTLIK